MSNQTKEPHPHKLTNQPAGVRVKPLEKKPVVASAPEQPSEAPPGTADPKDN